MSYSPVFQSTSSEKRWVQQINKTVSKQVVVDIAPPPISIFRVPKEVVDTKPEAYIPERIGLGPYHHFRAEMQKMLRHKLAAIKKILTPQQIHDFQSLAIDRLENIEPNIRACYDEYLDLDGDTLAWILAVDGLFLLYRVGYGLTMNPQFHQKPQENSGDGGQSSGDGGQSSGDGSQVTGDDKTSPAAVSSADDSTEIRIVNEEIQALESDISWKDIAKIPQEVIIHPRDTLMLENQIPILVLKELLKGLSLSSKDNSLGGMLAAYGAIHSPLEMLPKVKFHHEEDDAPAHLLDYMYRLVVSNIKPKPEGKWEDYKEKEKPVKPRFEGFQKFLDNIKQVFTLAVADDSLPKPILLLKNLFFLTPFDMLVGNSKLDGKTVQEIQIPSVIDLYEAAKITFAAMDGGIRDIRYDEKEFVIYLPVINLESNSEVILRNMIAYEQAISAPGSIFELTEYIELMCGIIDTVKDVEMLREKGVIKGDLDNEGIVEIFNGIPRCKNVPIDVSNLRITFYKVKKRYNSRPVVRAYKFIMKQLVLWWKVLVITSTVLVVVFVIYTQVCDVYKCHVLGRRIVPQPLIKRLYGPM